MYKMKQLKKFYLISIFFIFSCSGPDPSEIEGINLICSNEGLFPVGLRIDSDNENLSFIHFGFGQNFWETGSTREDNWKVNKWWNLDDVDWSLKEISIKEESRSNGRTWQWIFVLNRETLMSQLTVMHKVIEGVLISEDKYRYSCSIIERESMEEQVKKLKTAKQNSISKLYYEDKKAKLKTEYQKIEDIKKEMEKNKI